MAANTIITSIVTGGVNSHATVAEEANVIATDFVSQGVVGSLVPNTGSGGTGSFCVNADTSPDMGITIKAGQAYISATPSSQGAQVLRARAAADYTAYTINANASGSTKYDWIYLKVDATKANAPAADASDVASLFTSRSSSNTTDNGSPPTYGIPLAIVTVANGASSITNSNITDTRIQTSMNNTGSNGANLETIRGETSFDFVASGCVWTGDSYASTLAASMTAGVVYISGRRVTVAGVTARAFTASKDTYIDVDNTGTITYPEATNNAASSALALGRLRLGIIVSGGSSIAASTSINQGQETRVLPIASSIPYAVTDSLGNLICPRDPNHKLLGYRQILVDFTTTSATLVDLTGLNLVCIIPTNRKVKVTLSCPTYYVSGGNTITWTIANVTASATEQTIQTNPQSTQAQSLDASYVRSNNGITNYKVQVKTTGNTFHTDSSSQDTACALRVELE